MPETVPACPLCGETASQLFDQRLFRGVPVTNRICRACGFVFQSPRMGEAELQEFYAAEYRQLYQGSPGLSARDLAVQAQRANVLVDFLRAAIKPPGALAESSICLDIGCSAGKLLEAYAQAFHCRVAGIEPGDAYRQDDQRRGLEVYASLEAFEDSGSYPCNLISLIHVLEHLPHPVQYLTHLRQKLLQSGEAGKNPGWLLLEVPNLYCHDCFEVAHLTSFSPHTLAQTLRQAGFEVVTLVQHGMPRSRWLPLYITTLARPVVPAAGNGAPSGVVPERNVALKRRLGLLQRKVVNRLFSFLARILNLMKAKP